MTKPSVSNRLKLSGIFFILATAIILTFGMPKTVLAAKTKALTFNSFDTSKVKISGKKLKLYGAPYSASTGKQQKKKWYSFKINGKTKYRELVDSETGKSKKIKKSTALKKLKKRNYIAVYVSYKKSNKVIN